MSGAARALLLAAAVATFAGAEKKVRRSDLLTPTPLPKGSLLVIGFLGAWEDWDHPKRNVRRLALKLREGAPRGLYVETAGNHSRGLIRKFVLEALDLDRNRKLSVEEARSSELILYGQSFGAAASVKLARELKKQGVQVRLIVMVDSIGRDDQVIPPNVHRVLNLYQRDPGPVRGESKVRAEDEARTTVLGNIPFTYLFREIDMSDYPKVTHRAPISHWKMDNDPAVWATVEAAIRAEVAAWKVLRRP